MPRPGKPKYSSLHVFMKKPKNWVFIPIASGDIHGEPDVAAALRSLPLKQGKYFFLGGTGSLRCNIASWRSRMNTLFDLVKENFGELSVHPTPHRFRHTFAARLLEDGMDIGDVAEMLGDSVKVVEKHYAKYTRKRQRIAAAKWEEIMLKRAAERKKKFGVIRGKRKTA